MMAAVNQSRNCSQTKVWQSLRTCLAPKDPDFEFWWQLTGYHLAHMVEAAGYTIERQYEILLFHYSWIVSYSMSHLAKISLVFNLIPDPPARTSARY